MEGAIDVNEIERKAYLSFHQDGFLDILAGIFILAFGLSMLNLSSIANSVMVVLWTWAITFFWRAKKAIIYPRLGYVNFSWRRITKEMIKLVALAGFIYVPLIVFLIIAKGFPTSSYAAWLKENETLSGQIFISASVSLGAILSRVKRLYIYAVLTWLVFVADYLLEIPGHLYFIPLGIAVILSGIFILIHFLHRYPKFVEDTANGEA